MRIITVAALLLWSSFAAAAVLNVEFHFAPFTGDLKKSAVQTVPGKASVYLNNVLVAEQPVERREVPVIFDAREVSAPIWVPMASLGPAVRKGMNKVRIEFEPADPKLAYMTQLRWTQVNDQVARGTTASGATTATNQSGGGNENKPATGKVVFEREFAGDFAADLPWHHYPAVATLTDEDRKRLTALIRARMDVFKPDFAAAYKLLQPMKGIDLAGVRKAKCLDAAYSAGVRITPVAADQLEFATTGNPEVVVKSRKGELYPVTDQKSFERIKGDEVQMCAGIVMSMLFPQRLVVVRMPSGEWQVAY
jgi:hypothetical protein